MSFFNLYGEDEHRRPTPPVALTIAGSDSGGGAGIQADLKSFAANRAFGTSVLTLITAQNTRGVLNIELLNPEIVVAQYEAVINDLKPRATKTGALGSTTMIKTVAAMLAEAPAENLVIDPVMISKHGDLLLPPEAYVALREELLPQATLVTPNRFEAAALIGHDGVETVPQMKEAARRIFDMGARAVIVKGGHFEKIVRDIYFDGTGYIEFGADRIDSVRLHGSGCTFSAVITARLAHQESLVDAIGFAREFISKAIKKAPKLGEGISPVNPAYKLWSGAL